ncbi:MAG: universal stress protein [Burkholderiaceae bacterium]|nr:universal stress protein [Burkholderiaceae bacterium]
MNADSYKVLLPVDGSPDALAAVRHALQRSSTVPGASFVLVNVQGPPSLYEVMVAHDADRIEAVRRDAGTDLLGAAEALLDAAGAEYESEVASGTAEHLIVELAENYRCHAIVMGARGIGAQADEGGLGPVALAVLQASPVPVTIVRAGSAGGAEEAAEDESAGEV